MRRIIYGPVAQKDLVNIFSWIARDNPAAAISVRYRVVLTIEGLASFSTGRMGRIKGTLDKVVPGLPYIVTYTVAADTDDAEIIRILTIRHTSRRPLGDAG